MQIDIARERRDSEFFEQSYFPPYVDVVHGRNGTRDLHYWLIQARSRHDLDVTWELEIKHDFSGDPDEAKLYRWDVRGEREQALSRSEYDELVEIAREHGDVYDPDDVWVYQDTGPEATLARVLATIWRDLNSVAKFSISWGGR